MEVEFAPRDYMAGIAYKQLDENQLQTLFVQKNDSQAFYELNQRYKPVMIAKWQKKYSMLYRKYPVAFEDFFDKLLEEAIGKWNPERASFQTFFVYQVCHRRVIDFIRMLWNRHYNEARPGSDFPPITKDFQDDEIINILEQGRRTADEEYPELFEKALAREKQDCQDLIRLMQYKGPKGFDEKTKILTIMGYKKKATGWRDTWKRNRERIADFVEKNRKD